MHAIKKQEINDTKTPNGSLFISYVTADLNLLEYFF